MSDDPPRLRDIKNSRLGVARRGRLIPGSGSGSGSTGLQPPRFNKRKHAKAFIAALKGPPFNGVVPKKNRDIELHITKLPFDPAENSPWQIEILKKNYAKLSKECGELTTKKRSYF